MRPMRPFLPLLALAAAPLLRAQEAAPLPEPDAAEPPPAAVVEAPVDDSEDPDSEYAFALTVPRPAPRS